MKFTAVGNSYKIIWTEGRISLIKRGDRSITPANRAGTENATKTSLQLGITYNFDLPGYTITLQTASIDGEEHQILVFSWLDAQGEPVHQAVDVSD